jgi:hypothetical protein
MAKPPVVRYITRGITRRLGRRREATMPLIQGGPPEWIWERTAEALKWEIVTSDNPDGKTVYELRLNCGLEIMRLQFFNGEEIRNLALLLAEHGP